MPRADPYLVNSFILISRQQIDYTSMFSGVFLLAILVPFANWKGASAGMIASHIVILTVTFGHLTIDKTVEFLDTSIEGCTNETFSSGIMKPSGPMFISLAQHKPIEVSRWIDRQELMSTTESPVIDNDGFTQSVLKISYMYYSLFGTLITVVVGMIVSLLTYSKDDAYDSKFIHPCVYKIAKWFPGADKLFSNETDIKNSSLKEPVEQHCNPAFDGKSEDIKTNEVSSHDDDESNSKFKSNIIYKSEMDIQRVENYKKLSEDETSQ